MAGWQIGPLLFVAVPLACAGSMQGLPSLTLGSATRWVPPGNFASLEALDLRAAVQKGIPIKRNQLRVLTHLDAQDNTSQEDFLPTYVGGDGLKTLRRVCCESLVCVCPLRVSSTLIL